MAFHFPRSIESTALRGVALPGLATPIIPVTNRLADALRVSLRVWWGGTQSTPVGWSTGPDCTRSCLTSDGVNEKLASARLSRCSRRLQAVLLDPGVSRRRVQVLIGVTRGIRCWERRLWTRLDRDNSVARLERVGPSVYVADGIVASTAPLRTSHAKNRGRAIKLDSAAGVRSGFSGDRGHLMNSISW